MSFSASIRDFDEHPIPKEARLVGYAALVAGLGLERPVAEPCITFDRHTRMPGDGVWRVIGVRQAPHDEPLAHLDFAMKHELLDLAVLKAVFQALGPADVARYVTETRTGIANRRAWFLYEWLFDERLPLPDLSMGNYVDAVEPDVFLVPPGIPSRRHRVRNNLGGTPTFCPLVRWTPRTDPARLNDIRTEVGNLMSSTPATLMRRAANNMLFGETRTTYALEGERPPRDKLERWANAIMQAGRRPIDEAEITRLQGIVLEQGAVREMGYRTHQNYIGTFDRSYNAAPDCINPRPEEVGSLMAGWESWASDATHLDPVAAAAMTSFGFLYIHPLNDGNGRLHRYLLHHVMAERKFVPQGVIFPVSVPIMEQAETYKSILHAFNRRVMPYTKWSQDGRGGVVVHNDVSDLFRYPDLTAETEFVHDCVARAALEHFPSEIKHVARIDRVMDAFSDIVDMPDSRMRDFIMFARQNPTAPNKLPRRRGKRDFADLEPEKVARLEEIIEREFGDEVENSAFGWDACP